MLLPPHIAAWSEMGIPCSASHIFTFVSISSRTRRKTARISSSLPAAVAGSSNGR
jgi:hypothetical protein